MNRTQEVELKLEVAPADVETCRSLEILGDPERRPVEQVTTYFDTPAGNLRKAGFSLRVRRRGRSFWQTLKQRNGEAGGFSSRAEWEKSLDGPELDFAALSATPIGSLLSKRDMKKRLALVSETRVRRTTWLVPLGASQIEVILDEGEVTSGDLREPISEMELELKFGDRADLFALAKEISRDVALRMGVNSKSERGFRLLEGHAHRARKAQRVKLEPAMSVADAFAAIVQSCLRHFRLNEGLISIESKGGPLHQARVALRRLRSAFSLFRPVTEDGDSERFRGELRHFAGLLGEARNLDVMLAHPVASRDRAARTARKRLRGDRDQAYRRVVEELRGPRLPCLILEIVAWAEAGEWRDGEAARAPVQPFAAEQLDRRWKKVRRDSKRFDELDAEQLHHLRIDVKKMRYACEFFAALVPAARRGQCTVFVGKLEEIQEGLGKLNDIETARTLAPPLDEAEERERGKEAQSLLRITAHNVKALREMPPYWR